MIKTTIVAFLLLTSTSLFASNLKREINQIESQWANIYYAKSNAEQKSAFPALLNKTITLSSSHPDAAEPIIWQAIIFATNAAYQSPFTALDSINKAKELLELAISMNPNALDGAAFVTLGTLYHLTPGWPISFGNQDKAEKMLKKGLTINPNSIDANYFYADYLLSKNKVNEATKYFKLALQSSTRTNQQFADTQLKKEAQIALKNTEIRKVDSGKNKFFSLLSSAKSN